MVALPAEEISEERDRGHLRVVGEDDFKADEAEDVKFGGLGKLMKAIEKQANPELQKLIWFIYWERAMYLDNITNLPEKHINGYEQYKKAFGEPIIDTKSGKLPLPSSSYAPFKK